MTNFVKFYREQTTQKRETVLLTSSCNIT